ncbi:hypothetical protein KKH13_04385 [Patescibacteria group bacterium]|nr:hypothetical protein [Patescibacteria group bacterium]
MNEPFESSPPQHKATEVRTSQNKQEMCQAGVKAAGETFKSEFGPLIQDQMAVATTVGLIEILPHDKFIEGMPVHRPDDEHTLGYRSLLGKVAIDSDAMNSQSHAYQVAYHEMLEEISAKSGRNLRSYHKFHDGIIQYFVRKTMQEQRMEYDLSGYEERADIVAILIQKGVPEELWKKALVNDDAFRNLMQTTNEVLENEQGFRKIDWALDKNDWPAIIHLLSRFAPDVK